MNEMNITSAQYIADATTNENIGIKAVIDGATYGVPLDPANSEYAEIMRQVAVGDLTIKDAD
tara:strand:+ start:179 stop:364 length:186 start_codon:yes stop_codon:yes gene_type:complete